MASSLEPKIVAKKADAAIAAYKAVKKGAADDEHVQVCSAASDKIVGILQNASTAAGDVVEVCEEGGCKAKLGGTVVYGDMLTADSSGLLVATTSNAEKLIAKAMSDGVANDVIPVVISSSIV